MTVREPKFIELGLAVTFAKTAEGKALQPINKIRTIPVSHWLEFLDSDLAEPKKVGSTSGVCSTSLQE
jgi:hypothetical protein